HLAYWMRGGRELPLFLRTLGKPHTSEKRKRDCSVLKTCIPLQQFRRLWTVTRTDVLTLYSRAAAGRGRRRKTKPRQTRGLGSGRKRGWEAEEGFRHIPPTQIRSLRCLNSV